MRSEEVWFPLGKKLGEDVSLRQIALLTGDDWMNRR